MTLAVGLSVSSVQTGPPPPESDREQLRVSGAVASASNTDWIPSYRWITFGSVLVFEQAEFRQSAPAAQTCPFRSPPRHCPSSATSVLGSFGSPTSSRPLPGRLSVAEYETSTLMEATGELKVSWLGTSVTVKSTVPALGQAIGSNVQVGEQPSPAVVLPSSHCSHPCRRPSPHCDWVTRHVAVQLHVFTLRPFFFPLSQASTPASTLPSPQVAIWHVSVHVPVAVFAAPSSHPSPGST